MRKDHFLPLDGLRGIAILAVLLTHTYNYNGTSLFGRGMESVARAGWVGVTLFFVLSGFLITGILLDTRGRTNYLRDFFARRSLRIFPLYFAFLAVNYFLVPHVPFLLERLHRPEPGRWIYYWTYTANMIEWFAGPTADGRGAFGHFWSLAVEEQVYLFWPFLILMVPRRSFVPVFVGIAFLSLMWRIVTRLTAQPIDVTYCWTPANLESFAAGAIVAFLSRENPNLLRSFAPGLAVASGCFIAGMWAGQRHFNFWESPVPMLTVGTTGLILFFAATIGSSITSIDRSFLNQALSVAWLRSFGKYSYAIYLFHPSVNDLVYPIVYSEYTGFIPKNTVLGGLLLAVAVTAFSFIAAFVSWYGWESQFLRLKKYFPLSGGVIRPEAEAATPGSSGVPHDPPSHVSEPAEPVELAPVADRV
jgi:peptidoglycan/LPS O-acetylase OafA/YrhL